MRQHSNPEIKDGSARRTKIVVVGTGYVGLSMPSSSLSDIRSLQSTSIPNVWPNSTGARPRIDDRTSRATSPTRHSGSPPPATRRQRTRMLTL